MKMILAAAVVLVSFTSSAAVAQERAGDAALGALSGAVVLGPVGAVAGAIVGYTAGPAIARSWGLRRSGMRQQERSLRRSATAASTTGPSTQATSVQGRAPQRGPNRTVAQAAEPQTSATEASVPSANNPARSPGTWTTPSVQGFE